MFRKPVDQITYHYSEYQDGFDGLPPHVRLVQGLPDLEELRANPEQHKLIVVDDMLVECRNSDVITTIATRLSHHCNVTLVYLTQNLFDKNSRTARLNMHYHVLFRNPADRSQISMLSRQMYPSKHQVLLDAFADATRREYGYLIVDMTQCTDDDLRLRTGAFPGETPIFYVPSS